MLFETPKLGSKEDAVIKRIDDLRQSLRYAVRQPRRWSGLLRQMLFARAIRGSNSIEGINVTLTDAVAAAQGDEPLSAGRATFGAVRGYRDAMTYVIQSAEDSDFVYGTNLFKTLHFMMMQYDLEASPGRWRAGPIYVRNQATNETVYEGPPAEEVPSLVKELIQALNEPQDHPAIVRAAMAHLNLVMIHPFRDGNGRMARALQTLVLAREGILAPEFSSIEEYLGRNTPDYYSVLAKVGDGRWQPQKDARPWLRFCLTAHFRQVSTVMLRIRESERVWESLTEWTQTANLPERVVYALFDAAFGVGIRNSMYRTAAGISEQTASRDLRSLVENQMLLSRGESRGRYYVASPQLEEFGRQARDSGPRSIEDPFAG